MANEQSDTQLAVLQPEKWVPDLLTAHYAKAPFLDRINNFSQNVSKDGDKVNIPLMPTFSASAVTAATGAVTYSQDTITEVELAIDQWQHVAYKTVRKATRQTSNGGRNWEAQYKEGLKAALVEDIANKVLSESANVTSYDITSASASQPGEDELTAAIQKLDDDDTPTDTGELTFVVTPKAYWSMKKQAFLRDADKMGLNIGGMLQMQVSAPYGVPIFKSTQVTTDTERENLLFHREAFAWAIQEDMQVEEVPVADALAHAFAAHYLAGFKTIRESFAVIIRSAA